MIRLFLDTEWADLEGRQLVSLAVVSENGQHCLYAEIDPLPEHPTDFVRHVVYPLLERGKVALLRCEFTRRLRAFFVGLGDNCVVYFDCALDGDFLRHALVGFVAIEPVATSPSGIVVDLPSHRPIKLPALQAVADSPPIEVRPELLMHSEVQHYLERYFLARPEMAAARHHAGIDVEALRRAYLAAFLGLSVESGR